MCRRSRKHGQFHDHDAVLHRRRRPRRDDARIPARAGGRSRRGAGEARRFLPRFPRRHGSSLDARDHVRARAHRRIPEAAASEGRNADRRRSAPSILQFVDFRHLPTHCKFIALMPQWDFLNFLAEQGKRYPTFDLRMQAEATDLIEENGRVAGLIARTPDGALTIRADLVGRLRRTPFDRARESGLQERGLRRADGCAVVSPVAQGRATAPTHSAISRRADLWSCSIAAITGNAPMSFRKAGSSG